MIIELLKRIRQAFFQLMFKPAHIAIVGLLGTYTALWGAWVAGPWNVFSTAALYSGLLALAPEWFWGLAAFAIGILVCSAAATHWYGLNRIGGAVLFILWLVIGVLYLASDWHNTGGITALFFAVYGGYIFVNTKLNSDLFHHRRKNFALGKDG